MGALRQPKLEPKKPVAPETRKLDRYGRDPESLPEKLRALTNYETDAGYAPAYHAATVDLIRLSSGKVCTDLCMILGALSYGRPRGAKDPRQTATLPVSSAELAEYCRCNVRDIQRQLSEMEDRKMISVKTVKNGTTKYVISLLYQKWQELEDYAVWKRRQIVEIDEVETDDESEDAEQMAVSAEALQLFQKPAKVRPGRASRAVKLKVGVREVVCQNDSPTVDAAFSAVVQSGRLVVSATFKEGEREAKGETKANAERHPRREHPANGGSQEKRTTGESHPLASEVVNLFEPLLRSTGSRLLSPDQRALDAACAELGNMPIESLVYFVMKPGGRAERAIKSPLAVASIIREARQNWEKGQQSHREHHAKQPRCKCGGEIYRDGMCMDCVEKPE